MTRWLCCEAIAGRRGGSGQASMLPLAWGRGCGTIIRGIVTPHHLALRAWIRGKAWGLPPSHSHQQAAQALSGQAPADIPSRVGPILRAAPSPCATGYGFDVSLKAPPLDPACHFYPPSLAGSAADPDRLWAPCWAALRHTAPHCIMGQIECDSSRARPHRRKFLPLPGFLNMSALAWCYRAPP